MGNLKKKMVDSQTEACVYFKALGVSTIRPASKIGTIIFVGDDDAWASVLFNNLTGGQEDTSNTVVATTCSKAKFDKLNADDASLSLKKIDVTLAVSAENATDYDKVKESLCKKDIVV